MIFSALTIIAMALIATLFTFGYLSAFDWRLIWIIEYTDSFLKIGLVAVATFSLFSLLLLPAVGCFYVLRTKDWRAEPWAFGFAAVVLFLLAWGALYSQYLASAWFCLILAGYLAFYFVKNFAASRVAIWRWTSTGLGFVLLIYLSGISIGLYNKELPGFKRDVYLKDAASIRDVGLVMITSRYVLLYTGDHTVIYLVGDVTKIEARPQHTTD